MTESSELHADPRPRRRTALLAVAGVVVVAGIGLALVSAGRPSSSEPETAASTGAVEVGGGEVRVAAGAREWRYLRIDVAQEGPALEPLPAPARVAFDEGRSSAVGAPLAGRIEQVQVRLGDRVTAGARLFAVRSGALADVERDIGTARTWVDARRRVADRTAELVTLQTAAGKELEEAKASLAEAELTLRAAISKRDSLRVAGTEGTRYWVTAPRAGTVVELSLASGQEVGPEHEPLLRVADLDEVLVLADLQERDARDVAEGQTVRIRTSAGDEVPGRVSHVGEVMDPERRTVQVRIRAPNRARALRPNAYVDVTLPAAVATRRVRVPGEAVVTQGTRPVVFLATASGSLARKPVSIGRERDGEVEILSGLEPGQRYVSRGALLLENEIDLAE